MAKTITIPYILLLLLLLVATTTAEPRGPGWMLPPDNSSALAPSPGGSECFSALLGTSDCLTFVGPKSNLTKPDPGCCPQITNLMKTQPVCLCKLVGNPDSIGLTVDRNRALKLPAACNITTPPLSFCSAIGAPVSIPSPSAAPTPEEADHGLFAAGQFPIDNVASSPSIQHLLGLASVLLASLFEF